MTLTLARSFGLVDPNLFHESANWFRRSSTAATAKKAAGQLNARVKNSTILRANAKIYAPAPAGQGSANSLNRPSQAVECDVLHLLLGPLHLDLLGLIVDLNKIELDIKAIPGSVLGDLFCQLAPPPAPPSDG